MRLAPGRRQVALLPACLTALLPDCLVTIDLHLSGLDCKTHAMDQTNTRRLYPRLVRGGAVGTALPPLRREAPAGGRLEGARAGAHLQNTRRCVLDLSELADGSLPEQIMVTLCRFGPIFHRLGLYPTQPITQRARAGTPSSWRASWGSTAAPPARPKRQLGGATGTDSWRLRGTTHNLDARFEHLYTHAHDDRATSFVGGFTAGTFAGFTTGHPQHAVTWVRCACTGLGWVD